MIHPMKILEDKNEGDVLRYDLERFAELPHHALASGPLNLPLQRRSLIRPYEGGKLDQPGWCICGQCSADEVPPLATAELSESFEDGIVRLFTPKTLHR